MISLSKKQIIGAAFAVVLVLDPAEAAESKTAPPAAGERSAVRLSPEREARIRAAYTTELPPEQAAAMNRLTPEQRERVVTDAIDAELEAVLLHERKLARAAAEETERSRVLEVVERSGDSEKRFNWASLFPATRVNAREVSPPAPVAGIQSPGQRPRGPAVSAPRPADPAVSVPSARVSEEERLRRLAEQSRAIQAASGEYQAQRARLLAGER